MRMKTDFDILFGAMDPTTDHSPDRPRTCWQCIHRYHCKKLCYRSYRKSFLQLMESRGIALHHG
jgi:hypothetical protein